MSQLPAPPPVPTSVDFHDYISAATEDVGDQSSIYNAETNAAQVQQQNLNTQADNTNAQITTVQQQYADLSKEFSVEEGQEQKTTQQQGNANIGSAEVAMAKSGVDQSAQGSFAAPVQQANNDLQAKVADIATKYGAKQQDLTDTVTGSVQQLQQQAAQYTAQGNQVMADLATTIAGQKVQQNQQIISLAQQMASAETTAEQDAWKDYMDLVTQQHEEDTLALSEATLANTERVDSARLAIEEQNASNSNLPKVTATKDKTTGAANGLSFTSNDGDPISLGEYIQQNGDTVNLKNIGQVLATSPSQGDKKIASDIATGKVTTLKQLPQYLLDGLST